MVQDTQTNIKSEESAERRTVEGWVCKHCSRYWGSDERMARYCCATDFPCECGGRHSRRYTCCDSCQQKRISDRWFAKPAVEWDGKFPIALWDDDQFFFDADDLQEYLDEHCLVIDESLWLTTCEANNGRCFYMSEHLEEDLPPGFEGELQVNERGINEIVNGWIKANAPYSWSMTGERLDIESVKSKL